MPTTLLVPKPVRVDLALCKRLAQEACRRASAAGLGQRGRLNRQQCALEFARELAEKDAAELRQLTAALVYELKS